jgi:hypothetical protein|tara:strand:+ start:452 stop:586 length:135 start_codon:yes stop_codon:yes gene_type:complete
VEIVGKEHAANNSGRKRKPVRKILMFKKIPKVNEICAKYAVMGE